MWTVRQVAERAGVTVRTLHHYDEIGLLKPSGRNESGYRLYSHEDLRRLREIFAWRQLGFSLREVQELVDGADRDRAAALRHQLTLAREQLTRAAALVEALEETMVEGVSSMTPLVLVDAEGQELGRCSIDSRASFLHEAAHADLASIDLGPLGYFCILDVRNGDPVVLVAEPAERPEWPYEIVIRTSGVERRSAFVGPECSTYSVGDRLEWPPERGATPVEHEVVAIRPAAAEHRTVIAIERVA